MRCCAWRQRWLRMSFGMQLKLLITGANGFIGSSLCEEALIFPRKFVFQGYAC